MILQFQENATKWKKAGRQAGGSVSCNVRATWHNTQGSPSLKWNQQICWACSLGSFLPLTILVLHALWVKCWLLPCNQGQKPLLTTPLQDSRALMPLCLQPLLCQQAAQHFGLTLYLLQLSISDIKASGTPVRFSSLMLIIGTKPKKHDHSSNNVSDDQCDKRAHIRNKKEPIDDGGHRSNANAGSASPVTGCDTTPIKGGKEWEPLINIGDTESDRHDPAPKHNNIRSGCSLPHVQPECSNGVQPKNQEQ